MIIVSGERVSVGNVYFSVNSNGFICEAPARVSITETKTHSGYESSNKCIEGDYISRRVLFIMEVAPLRTVEPFRRCLHPLSHHTGKSILLLISNIDMVQCFPFDYMHLVF